MTTAVDGWIEGLTEALALLRRESPDDVTRRNLRPPAAAAVATDWSRVRARGQAVVGDAPEWAGVLTGALERYRSGVRRLALFPQRFDDVQDLIVAHAQPVVVLTNVAYSVAHARDQRASRERLRGGGVEFAARHHLDYDAAARAWAFTPG